jgi:hypothetical protein
MRRCAKCGEEIEDPFDSCWKCAGASPEKFVASPKQALGWRDYAIAVLASGLMPFLVFGLQSTLLLGSYQLRHAWLEDGMDLFRRPAVWLVMAFQAALAFLALLPFLAARIGRRIAYAVLCILWTLLLVRLLS